MVNAAIAVFLRDGRLFVTPISGGGGLYFEDGEPVVLEKKPEALASQLPQLFAQSRFPATPLEPKTGPGKLPALAGVKTHATFARRAQRVDLRRRDEDYQLYHFEPFVSEFRGNLAESRPLETSHVELAEWVLRWLEHPDELQRRREPPPRRR